MVRESSLLKRKKLERIRSTLWISDCIPLAVPIIIRLYSGPPPSISSCPHLWCLGVSLRGYGRKGRGRVSRVPLKSGGILKWGGNYREILNEWYALVREISWFRSRDEWKCKFKREENDLFKDNLFFFFFDETRSIDDCDRSTYGKGFEK